MEDALPQLRPPERLLCGPGPTNVDPAVLEAMTRPMLGHLDPKMHEILLDVVGLLRRVYRMPDGLVLPLHCTGTAGMEAGIVNLVEPGDTVIVAQCGFFGRRIAEIARRHGARVVTVRADWGECVSNDALMEALDHEPRARMVAVVHAETSTGVEHPLAELGAALRDRDTLLMADCVTSLAGDTARGRRLGRGLRLLVHPEVPGGTARDVARGRVRAGDGPAALAPHAGAVHVRPAAARALLGGAPGHVPPHGADPRDLRAARGALRRAARGTRGALAAARRGGGTSAGCAGGARAGIARGRGPPPGAADRRASARGRGRQGRAGPDAARARDRDRRRPRPGRAGDVADRPDGPERVG